MVNISTGETSARFVQKWLHHIEGEPPGNNFSRRRWSVPIRLEVEGVHTQGDRPDNTDARDPMHPSEISYEGTPVHLGTTL